LKEQELLSHLTDLARRLGLDVRTDQGPFRDGSCRLVSGEGSDSNRRLIVLNRASSTQKRVAALTRALSECPLGDVYLLPAVRSAIEKYRSQGEDSDDLDKDENPAALDGSLAPPSSTPEAPCPNPL